MNHSVSNRILCIIDDYQQREAIQHAFSSLHPAFSLDIVATFRESWQYLGKRNYLFCLVSYQVEPFSCLNFINELLASEQRLPTILIGADDQSDIAVDALNLGVVDVLPIDALTASTLRRIVRYVTNLAFTQHRLRNQENLLNQVIETVAAGIFILQENYFVFANPMVSALTGYSQDELREKSLLDFVKPDMHGVVQSWIPTKSDSPTLSQSDVAFFTQHGRELWVNLTLTPIQYNGGHAVLGAFINTTRNRQMQRDLLEKEARYRRMIESSNDIIVLIELSGKVRYISPSVKTVLGYDVMVVRDHEIFSQVAKGIHPDDLDQLLAGFATLLKSPNGASWTLEHRIKHRQGHWLWVELVAINWTQEPGLNAIVINARDIDQRKTMENDLRQSETRYRLIADNAYDVILTVDANGGLKYISPSLEKTTGYKPEELLEQRYINYVHPDDMSIVRDMFRDPTSTVYAQDHAEFRIRHQQGEYLWFEMSKQRVLNESGALLMHVVSLRNIDKRKRAEVALRESEQRYRLLAEHTSDLIALYQLSGELSYLSPSIERILGYTSDEIRRSGLIDLVHPDDFVRLGQQLPNDALSRDALARFDVQVRAKNGEYIWLDIFTNPIKDAQGNIMSVLITGREITVQKEALEAERQQRTYTEALLDTAAALNSTLSLSEILERILNNLKRVVSHEWANIMLIEDDIARIVLVRGYQEEAYRKLLQEMHFEVYRVPGLKQMITDRRPLVVPDVNSSDSWVKIPGSELIRSYIGVPIVVGEEVIGFINLDSPIVNFFTEKMLDRLKAFADQVAIAIQNVKAIAHVQELAAVAERQRLARELHDAVSQTLFSASVISETLPLLLDNDLAEVRNGLTELSKLTKGALAEMRTLLLELRPMALAQTDLSVLIAYLVNSMQTRLEASIEFHQEGTEFYLEPDVKINLYRIVQEALSNVVKHAQATKVDLTLHFLTQDGQDVVRLNVQDNGHGFDLDTVAADHMGLHIMSERAQSAGISLRIASQSGYGTVIETEYAVPAHEARSDAVTDADTEVEPSTTLRRPNQRTHQGQ